MNKIFKIILLTAVILSARPVFSQTVLMQEVVDSCYSRQQFGVNSKHFAHVYWAWGVTFGKDLVTKPIKTNMLIVGIRYKYKINNFWALGSEIEYQYQTINYPVSGDIITDKYNFRNFSLAIYNRINLGRRGDIMGKFFDVVIGITQNILNSHYLEQESNSSVCDTYSYTEYQLAYFNSYTYGFELRIGINRYILFTKYRYTPLLKEAFGTLYKDIPRWTVGLQIGIHR